MEDHQCQVYSYNLKMKPVLYLPVPLIPSLQCDFLRSYLSSKVRNPSPSLLPLLRLVDLCYTWGARGTQASPF